jgi:amino acid transporter
MGSHGRPGSAHRSWCEARNNSSLSRFPLPPRARTAVGVSIFSIMAPAAKVAGTGMLPALALASIPMIVFAVVYAFIGSTAPRSGASFERPARFIHQFAGVMVAWLRVVGNTGALTVLTLVLVSYVSRPVTLPQKPTRFMLLLAFCAVFASLPLLVSLYMGSRMRSRWAGRSGTRAR